jgi:hypothetical protein
MKKILSKLKEEFFVMLPPTIYFFVVLHIVKIVRTLMAEGSPVSLGSTTSIAIAALILGKSVLIADLIPLVNLFPRKPLIYNVAWKSFMYLAVATLIHFAERLYDFHKETGGFAGAARKLLGEIVWRHFWAIEILICVLIVGYSIMHELTRVIGKEKVRRIFFGPMPTPQI